MSKFVSGAWLAAAILLSLGGIAGFILIFGPGLNVFWLILAPIIIAVYQFPAVAVYYFWKKRKKRESVARTESIDTPSDGR